MLDTLTLFSKYASALELTDAERKNARDTMQRAEIGADDPTVMWFCILAKFDALSRVANGEFVSAGKHLLANLDKKLKDGISEQLSDLPFALSAEARKFLETENAKLIDQTAKATAERLAETKRYNNGKLALGAAVVLLAVYGWGHINGGMATTAEAAKWQALQARSDYANLTRFAIANDWNKVDSECGMVGQNQQRGVPACNPTLYKERPLADSNGSNGLRLIFAEYTAKLGTVGTLGVTLLAGLGLGWFVWGRKKAA
jgi:hypothetical protein